MPVNNFSTGRDVTLVVSTPTGPMDLTGITNFTKKQMNTKLKSKGLDGIPRHGTIPDGWGGSLRFDRLSPNLDRFFALQEAGYYAGQNLQSGTILETISEADGSLSQYRYVGVVVTFDDAGDASADKKVEQTVSWEAETRLLVA